jgi:hypothetical protein
MIHTRSLPRFLALVLLMASTLPIASCDTGTTKTEAQYQALLGTWEIVVLEVDGISYTTETGARYDSLQVTFSGTAGDASFAFRGEKDAQNILSASGPVTVFDASQSLALTRGPETVIATYEITQSRRAILAVPPGRPNGSDVLLEILLPNIAWSGNPSAELRLERL